MDASGWIKKDNTEKLVHECSCKWSYVNVLFSQ